MSSTTRPSIGADFDRLVNLRDLGGLPVRGGGQTRHGVLLRSEELSYASADDAHHLHHVVGLRTIVDLRTRSQAEARSGGPLRETIRANGAGKAIANAGTTCAIEEAGTIKATEATASAEAPITIVSLPCHDTVAEPEHRHAYYAGLLESYGSDFAGLVRRITQPDNIPVLVHCHLGFDRTGTVVALLLRLADVDDDAICADYARSSGAEAAVQARYETDRLAAGKPPLDDAFYRTWAIRAEIMQDALALVDARWGSMRGWAAAHALTEAEIAARKATLVEAA